MKIVQGMGNLWYTFGIKHPKNIKLHSLTIDYRVPPKKAQIVAFEFGCKMSSSNFKLKIRNSELFSGENGSMVKDYRFTPKTNHVSTVRIFNLKCNKSQALNDFLQMNSNSNH
jgi:hypothetical protein